MTPSAATWARIIKAPLDHWPGNCHAIATAIVAAGLVPGGTVTRGLWWGPMAGRFAGRAMTGHSWITRPDGLIVDPTRWVFEGKRPYIYVGPQDAAYDPGGNRLRGHTPCPAHDADDREVTLHFDDGEIADEVRALLPSDSLALEGDPYVQCNVKQAAWLANLPPTRLGHLAVPVFRALTAADLRAFIPVDNRRTVLGG